MNNLFCLILGGAVASVPGPLPFEATAPDGRSFTDLAGQYAGGYLTLDDLAWLGQWPAIVVEPNVDPETEVALGLTSVIDEASRTVTFTREKRALTQDELDARERARNPVPEFVTSAQACVTLDDVKLPDGSSLLDKVEAIMPTLPRSAQIWFARAQDWYRNNVYVAALGMELDLDDDAVDALFRKAKVRM